MRKTFAEKMNREFKSKILELSVYGTEADKSLEMTTVKVGTVTRRIKQEIQSLKNTANLYGAHSLSANQANIDGRFFIMAKHMKEGIWIDRKHKNEINYDVIINPQITAASKIEEYGWEYCVSFPNIRASVKRFESIKVAYKDEEWEDVEKELKGFQARVFQHELDHLLGRHILNWEISFGENELIPGAREDFPHFEQALLEYKQVLAELRKEHPEDFEVPKHLKQINPLEEEDDLDYWTRNPQRRKRIFPREEEFGQRLYDAIQKDFNTHEEEGKYKKNDPNLI